MSLTKLLVTYVKLLAARGALVKWASTWRASCVAWRLPVLSHHCCCCCCWPVSDGHWSAVLRTNCRGKVLSCVPCVLRI